VKKHSLFENLSKKSKMYLKLTKLYSFGLFTLLQITFIYAPVHAKEIASLNTPTYLLQTQTQKWNEDPAILSQVISALGSILAVFLSLVAVYISWTSSNAQLNREKREEFRQILEILLNLRTEFASVSANPSLLNSKKLIYLQAAEGIAEQIPRQISSAEYLVLAEENNFEADYKQSRLFFIKAVHASSRKGSSEVYKAQALRFLATDYFYGLPKDFEKGRKFFKESIDAVAFLSNQGYYYPTYTQGYNYWSWALSEISIGKFEDGYSKLCKMNECFSKLPKGFVLVPRIEDVAVTWKNLVLNLLDKFHLDERNSFFIQVVGSFEQVLEILENTEDDHKIELCGMIYEEWGAKELSIVYKDKGLERFRKAKQNYTRLSEKHPQRLNNNKRIEEILRRFNHNDANTPL
jgi:hypothetical protein